MSSHTIRLLPLGAGQDVGRSCIILSIRDKHIMLDCGMHMGYSDNRRFPDFNLLTTNGTTLTQLIDCVVVSHFHLDHVGALPYMTEVVGYDGPIFMTYPTKAVSPILLEDMRKVMAMKDGEQVFSSEMIANSMAKVTPLSLNESVNVENEIFIRTFPAGHVLGAAMFLITVNDLTVLYTGDFNMTADRHLGAAKIEFGLSPHVLISESTYATTVRQPKRFREREFLSKIQNCLQRNGKVLVPVFALGRAQELCILLENHWDRLGLDYPIYFTAGLVEKAHFYYRLFVTWESEKIKETFVNRNLFEFKHIRVLEKGTVDEDVPMVVFATPGMLHAGLSLQIFKKWHNDPKNLLIIPGYCVQGTVGEMLLSGKKKFKIDGEELEVKMGVEYLSFSAHADLRGIVQLITQCRPQNVVFVHGEASKMMFLAGKVTDELGIPCFTPANGDQCEISVKKHKFCWVEKSAKPTHVYVDMRENVPVVCNPAVLSRKLGLEPMEVRQVYVHEHVRASFDYFSRLLDGLESKFGMSEVVMGASGCKGRVGEVRVEMEEREGQGGLTIVTRVSWVIRNYKSGLLLSRFVENFV